MTPFDVVLGCVATFRLARLVTEDVVLDRPRDWIVKRFPKREKLHYFITCPWCTSTHIAALSYLWWYHDAGSWRVAMILASWSAVAGLLSAWSD